MQKKREYLLFFPVSFFLIFAVIRLINPLQFWVDELFHVFAAISVLENGQPMLPSGIPYERSFPTTLLVAGSFKILGISEISARLPFMIIGIFSIIASYYLVREVFDHDSAILTAFLLSFSPLQIHWSLNARMYVVLQFLYVLFLFILHRLFQESLNANVKKKQKQKRIVLVLFSLVLIMLLSSFVHQFYLLFLVTALTLLTFLVQRKQIIEEKILEEKNILIFFIIIVSATMLIVRLTIQDIPFLPSFAPIGMQVGTLYYFILLARYFTILSIFAFLSFVIFSRKNSYNPLIIIAFFVPFIILTLFLDAKNSRYLFFAFPLFVALASNGIIETWKSVHNYEKESYRNICS
ncbi:MAG: glycosyltransferase family 39 protein [Methanolobus sp.]